MKKFLLVFLTLLFCSQASYAENMVDINTATLSQLDTLTGIGPTYAQRIIDDRPYSSVDDLLRVKGIGPTTLQKIKDQGLAYVGGQAQQPAQTSTAPNPTPIASPTPTYFPVPTQTAAITTPIVPTTAAVTYPSGVIFNEVLPSPVDADELNEWIEFYNRNNFEIDLSNWKIQDSVGTITTYVFPTGTKIPPLGYLILTRPQSKILLNNSSDGLNLFWPDGKTADSMELGKASLGFSYNLTSSGWKWSSRPTPGFANFIAGNTSQAKTSQIQTSSKKTSENPNEKSDLTSALINSVPEEKPLSFLFFSGILLSLILGIIFFVIIIKLKAPNGPV